MLSQECVGESGLHDKGSVTSSAHFCHFDLPPKPTLLENPVEQQSKTPPDMLPSDLAQIVAGTRHAWQGGHKAFQCLGNAPAAPNPSGQRNRCGIGFSERVRVWLSQTSVSDSPSLSRLAMKWKN